MNDDATRPAARVSLLLVGCFLVRAALGLWWAVDKPEQFIGGDGAEYLDTARHIAHGDGYLISFPRLWDWELYQPNGSEAFPRPEVFRPPLYSMLLAPVVGLVPNSLWMIAILNAALSTLAGWFLFDLTRRALSAVVAGIALTLYAIYPLTAVLGAKVGAESLFGLLLCGSVWCLWRAKEERPVVFAIAAGVCLGLATLTRSNAIFLWPLGCLWLFFCARSNRMVIVWFTALVFVALLPWAVRNRIQTGQWIFLSGSGGYNLWLGNNETAYRMFTARDSAEYDRWGRALLQEDVPRMVHEMGPRNLAGAQEFWYGAAKRYIREHPGKWMQLVAVKSVEFWRPYVRPGFFPQSYVILSLVSTLPLFVLAVWGLLILFRDKPAVAWLLVAVMLAGMGGLVLSHVHVRLRVPFADTFLTIPAAVTIADFWRRRLRSSTSPQTHHHGATGDSGAGTSNPPSPSG